MAWMQFDDRRLNSPAIVTFFVLAFYLLFSLAAMIWLIPVLGWAPWLSEV